MTKTFFKNAAQLLCVLSLATLSLAIAPPTAAAQEVEQVPSAPGLVVVESTQSFEETWSSLIAALDANPAIRTIAQVDHAAAAAAAGLTLENNRVVFFGNPAIGTPLMQASRTAGIDLPQKMQVFVQGTRVFVAYNAPSYISQRHQTGAVASLTPLGNALAALANAATNTQATSSAPSQPSPSPAAGLVTTASANDFETTWSQLIEAIEGSPAAVAFTVDHGANSGGSLPSTRLVVFGNPAIGTPIMASAATSGVDLPLKILVYEDDAGVTQVVSTSPAFVQSRHGVGDVATIGGATGAIANFTTAATTSTDPAPASTPDAEAGEEDEAGDDSEAGEDGEDEVLGINELAFTGSDPLVTSAALALMSTGGFFLVTARRRE